MKPSILPVVNNLTSCCCKLAQSYCVNWLQAHSASKNDATTYAWHRAHIFSTYEKRSKKSFVPDNCLDIDPIYLVGRPYRCFKLTVSQLCSHITNPPYWFDWLHTFDLYYVSLTPNSVILFFNSTPFHNSYYLSAEVLQPAMTLDCNSAFLGRHRCIAARQKSRSF